MLSTCPLTTLYSNPQSLFVGSFSFLLSLLPLQGMCTCVYALACVCELVVCTSWSWRRTLGFLLHCSQPYSLKTGSHRTKLMSSNPSGPPVSTLAPGADLQHMRPHSASFEGVGVSHLGPTLPRLVLSLVEPSSQSSDAHLKSLRENVGLTLSENLLGILLVFFCGL